MAVEIRELVIKATIVEDSEATTISSPSAEDKTKIVQECVKQVLKIIAKSKNR